MRVPEMEETKFKAGDAELIVPKSVTDGAGAVLVRLFGPFMEQADLWAEKIKAKRMENALSVIKRFQDLEKDASIKIDNIPIKFIAPFFEGASAEDDPKIQEMWANLLNNQISTSGLNGNLYANILKNMNKSQAEFFNFICDYYDNAWEVSRDPDLSEIGFKDIHDVSGSVKKALRAYFFDIELAVYFEKGRSEIMQECQDIIFDSGNGFLVGFSAPVEEKDLYEEFPGVSRFDLANRIENISDINALCREQLLIYGAYTHEIDNENLDEFVVSWVYISPMGWQFYDAVTAKGKASKENAHPTKETNT